ncbi:cGMP-dependent 3',5'-cyclic phosphodiesterase-like [Atheta coriaria]|uniref:cGMP-dependent 3',5'-cyclic phosphodiesterase-like n=1 Tax=Dalotia coriaria TaxID=877792 RepID=UPI0031F38B76
MDDFCQYNLFRKPRPALFIPPPYDKPSETHCERMQTPLLHLRATDPSKILLLCESLKDQCTMDLEAKINCYLMIEAECDCAFMAFFEVLPKLAVVKVMGVHALEPEIQLPTSDPAIATIGENKAGVNFAIENLPPVLLQQLEALKLDLEGGDIMAYPIFEQKHRNGIAEETSTLSLAVFIINSTRQKIFLKDIVQECFRFVLPILTSTIAFERQSKIKGRLQELLEIGRVLFDNLNDREQLLNKIMERGKCIFESERCDIYFIDEKQKNLEANVICNGKLVLDVVSKNQGVIGMSYTQNKLLNIENAHDNPLFLKSDDEKCAYHTRNILCFPIPHKEKVLGCIQMRNKFGGDFNVFDENITSYFATYVALAISQCEMLTQLRAKNARHDISNKLLLFQFDFREAEVEHLLNAQRHDLNGFNFPTFNSRTVPYHRIGVCMMKMFEDLNFIQKYKLERRALAKFLVLVQKGYFNHPYHNYDHAFSVAHFIYSTVCYLQLLERNVLTGLDVIALLIAAICHNVDHHGMSNPFRTVEESTFASLYSSSRSIMETHHFAQTMTILNSEGCNFLANFSSEDYSSIVSMIRGNIIATDYAEHLKHFKKQEILLTKNFKPRLLEHKLLFCALLMTCGDFVDHVRDWRTVRTAVAQMYEEYFRQGDLEREMGKVPNEMMDREKARIPLLQINLLKDVVLPPYELLVKVYPDMHFCIDAIYENITNWELSKAHFLQRVPSDATSIELLMGNQLSMTNFHSVEEEHHVETEESYVYDYDD